MFPGRSWLNPKCLQDEESVKYAGKEIDNYFEIKTKHKSWQVLGGMLLRLFKGTYNQLYYIQIQRITSEMTDTNSSRTCVVE